MVIFKHALEDDERNTGIKTGTIPLTEEQFENFAEQTIATEHSRRILDGLTAQDAATAPAQGAGTAVRGNTPSRRQNRPYNTGGRRRWEHGTRVTRLRNEVGGTILPRTRWALHRR